MCTFWPFQLFHSCWIICKYAYDVIGNLIQSLCFSAMHFFNLLMLANLTFIIACDQCKGCLGLTITNQWFFSNIEKLRSRSKAFYTEKPVASLRLPSNPWPWRYIIFQLNDLSSPCLTLSAPLVSEVMTCLRSPHHDSIFSFHHCLC